MEREKRPSVYVEEKCQARCLPDLSRYRKPLQRVAQQ